MKNVGESHVLQLFRRVYGSGTSFFLAWAAGAVGVLGVLPVVWACCRLLGFAVGCLGLGR
jgi:hypothetical protein